WARRRGGPASRWYAPGPCPASWSAAPRAGRPWPASHHGRARLFSDFVAEIFTALLAPAGTPREAVDILIAAVAKLSKDPAVIEKAERAGYAWVGAGPDAFKRKMAQEIAQSQEVIRFSGIKAG